MPVPDLYVRNATLATDEQTFVGGIVIAGERIA